MPSKYIADVGRNSGNYKFGGGKNNIYLTDSSQSDLNTVTYGGVDYRVGYVINSGGGDDIIQGAAGKDCLIGGAGADYLRGLGADDVIDGGAGNDTLEGDGGADLMIGGDGDDIILMNPGADTVSGGAGADSFIFEEAIATLGVKTITDFTPGVDSLEFFMAFYPGLSLSVAYTSDADVPGAEIIYDSSTGELFMDIDGYGAGDASVKIAELVGKPSIADSDVVAF